MVEQLEQHGIQFGDVGLSMIPQNTIEVVELKTAQSLMRLLDSLEDHDDVQKVHANFDISDEIMESLSGD